MTKVEKAAFTALAMLGGVVALHAAIYMFVNLTILVAKALGRAYGRLSMAQGKHYTTPSEIRRARERKLFIYGFLWGAVCTLAVVVGLVALVLWSI